MAEHLGLPDHRHQGGDSADAPGDEQVPGGGREAEVVARAAEPDDITDVELGVDAFGAAASIAFAQHRNGEEKSDARPIDLRRGCIDRGGPVGQHEVDVRSGCPVGQPLPVGAREGETDDIHSHIAPRCHHQTAAVGRVATNGCIDPCILNCVDHAAPLPASGIGATLRRTLRIARNCQNTVSVQWKFAGGTKNDEKTGRSVQAAESVDHAEQVDAHRLLRRLGVAGDDRVDDRCVLENGHLGPARTT